VRIELEGFAAEEAARQATPADIARIAAFDAAFRQAASAEPPDSAEAVAANKDLHFAIYEATGLPTPDRDHRRLWLKAGPILNLDIGANPRPARYRRRHAAHADAGGRPPPGRAGRPRRARRRHRGAADFIIARKRAAASAD
jgi:DNA-binding GntR family transcriptional regulator